jgi:cold shock CspA family protein
VERAAPGGAFAEVLRGGTRHPRFGTVRVFDAGRGLGLVASTEGATFGFHSTAISDGSRRIDVGERVTFSVAAAPGGCFEAAAVSLLSPRGWPGPSPERPSVGSGPEAGRA